MPIAWGPEAASDGLVMCLDAANPKSNKAPGTGWYNVGSLGKWDYVSKSQGSPTLGVKGGAQCIVFPNAIGTRYQSSPPGFQSPAATMTMEAWIYPEANATGSTASRMNIFRANSGGSRAYMSYNVGNNRLSSYWYNSSPAGYHETVSFAPGRNVWQHFVAAWDGTTLRQYVNYENQGSVSTNSASSTFGTEIQIGYEPCCGQRQFVGGIAMIRLYNRALSDAEVFNNFNSTKGRFGF